MGWFETDWTYNIRVPQYADFKVVNEHSGSFIVNEFQIFKVLMILVILLVAFIFWYLFTKLVFIKCPKFQEKCMKVINFIKPFFFFDIFICIVVEAYFFLFIHSLAEAYGEFPTPSYALSYVLATSAFFGLIVLMLFIPYHYCRTRDKKIEDLESGKCRVFYLGLKVDKAWAGLLYLAFGVRRYLISLMIVFFSLTLTFYIRLGTLLLI